MQSASEARNPNPVGAEGTLGHHSAKLIVDGKAFLGKGERRSSGLRPGTDATVHGTHSKPPGTVSRCSARQRTGRLGKVQF